jgi:hypothetical protein
MANGVYHTGLGIELNLTEPDLGHPEIPGLWEILRADTRPVPERELQCIQCRQARPHCPEWMFLTERDGRRFASHFTRGIADHDASNESDEHKAYKERVVKAAELGGFRAEPENRSADGKRRTDVLVSGGPQDVGWEIQLSYAGLDSVRNRAALARRDEITPLWATVDPARDFIDRVPWALIRGMEWRFVATSPTIPVRGGVRTLKFWRCDNRIRPCPVKGVGGCGKLHEEWLRANNVSLDSLVRDSASGTYVPVVLPGKRARRWWITADDRNRFLDAGGTLLPEGEHRRQREKKPDGAAPQAQPLDPHCHYGEDSGYRSPPAEVRDDGTPVVTAATRAAKTLLDQAVLLDWSSRTHWGGGTARPCRNCGKPAYLVDDDGAPMHKTCAEHARNGGGQQ